MIITGSSFRWLLFLLVPYSIVVIVHFVVPLQFMIDSLPKAEKVYNQYKLESQQNSVRSLAILKRKIISRRMELWWRSSDLFTKIYKEGTPYMKTNQSQIQLRWVGNVTGKESNLDMSMWFVPGKSQLSQFDANQKNVMSRYLQAEPFLRATVPSTNKKELPSFQMIMNYSGSPLLLIYPTKACPAHVANPNKNIFTDEYNQTKENWFTHGYQYTSFVNEKKYKTCTAMIENQTQFTGVICSEINVIALSNQLTQLGGIKYNFSKNTYFLLTPKYSYSSPRVIFKIVDDNFTNVTYPLSQVFNIPQGISSTYWQPDKTNFQLYQFMANQQQTYFLTPISLPVTQAKKINILFLMTENNYKFADFKNQQKMKKFLISILTPSVIILIMSIIASIIVVRFTLKSMQNDIYDLQAHCKHILNNGLDVQLPEYKGSNDISNLYDACQDLNSLYKVSSQQFYKGDYAQRYLKYYQVYQYFKFLRYDYNKILEILGNCQFNMKKYQDASKHYDQVVQIMLKELQKEFGSLRVVYKLKMKKNKKLNTPKYKQLQALLKMRIFKYIYSRFLLIKPPPSPPPNDAKLQEYIQMYKKINYDHANAQIIFLHHMCCTYHMLRGQMKLVQKNIDKGNKFLQVYQKLYHQGKTNQLNYQMTTHPQVTRSSQQYIVGLYYQAMGNKAQAIKRYRPALQRKYFNIQIYQMVVGQLKPLLQSEGLLTSQLSKSWYFNFDNFATQRQYFILLDWTRSTEITGKQVSLWRKEVIQKIHYIFDKFVQPKDRFSMIKFDDDVDMVCALTFKEKNQLLLKSHIDSLKKQKSKRTTPNLKIALRDTFQRVRNLPLMKIFVIFLKKDTKLQSQKISNLIQKSDIDKYLIIFIRQDTSNDEKTPSYFIFNLDNSEDLQRMLGRKPVFEFINDVSPF